MDRALDELRARNASIVLAIEFVRDQQKVDGTEAEEIVRRHPGHEDIERLVTEIRSRDAAGCREEEVV